MNKMSAELFMKYYEDPLGMDGAVRSVLGIPADRYYVVSVWPEALNGVVRIERERAVSLRKVSKSDQK